MTVEEVADEGTDHDPTCDLFDRLNALRNDEELMDLATGFVLQLLRSAQDEALRRGHVPSKVFVRIFFSSFLLCDCHHSRSAFLPHNARPYLQHGADGTEEQNEPRVTT